MDAKVLDVEDEGRRFARTPSRSQVSAEIFEMFRSALKGEVTNANLADLSALCGEFGFELEIPSYRLIHLGKAMKS
jgi:shikimate kinase